MTGKRLLWVKSLVQAMQFTPRARQAESLPKVMVHVQYYLIVATIPITPHGIAAAAKAGEPALAGFKPRAYQVELLEEAKQKNVSVFVGPA